MDPSAFSSYISKVELFRILLPLGLVFCVAKFLGLVARKLQMPQVVGQILAGLILGPCVFGVVDISNPEYGLSIRSIAEIGVIMLMFSAGLGTNLKELLKTGPKAFAIACAGVFVPVVLGALLFMAFYGFGPIGSPQFIKGLFIGTVMAATSVSITVAALKELGKLSSTVGTTIVSAAIIDDVIGIVVLTFVLSSTGSGSSVWITMLKAVMFFAIAIVTGFIVYKAFKWLDARYEHTRRIPIAALVYCIIMAYVAERFFGIADITGAYVAGVVLCNLHDVKYVERKVDVSSYMVFAPIFFAGIGLKVSFESMNTTLLLFSVAFVAVALLSKIIGCGLVSRVCKFKWGDSLKIGIGMMTRGEVALITAQKGLNAGLITADYFTAVILMILVSSILAPILLKLLYRSKTAS